jgi:immune inhibitor A
MWKSMNYRILFLLSFVATASLALAIPAKRGLWKTVTTADGTTIKVQLAGDENLHYWQSEDGRVFFPDSATGVYQQRDLSAMRAKANNRVRSINARRRQVMRKATATTRAYTGEKKGLVIMVQFSDKSFSTDFTKSFCSQMMNTEGFSEGNYKGSVRDYFLDQSSETFILNFDVVGPVTLSHSYRHYGANDRDGYDKYPGEMTAEACLAIEDSVDFSDYDWDGDGEVDQVVILYAGKGEADGGSDNTIWPHEWYLSSSDYGESLTLDSVTVDQYAAVNELQGTEELNGIGTLCHEFSHCLGFPDLYDTSDEGTNFGMFTWSLMDYGSYNGDTYQPCAYTSYERMTAGWLTPTVLGDEDVSVTSMQPITQAQEAYIMYNENDSNEYVLLENRQLDGWDASGYGAGLLAVHVDYDEMAWYYNEVNNEADHQRCTIYHADNSDGFRASSLVGDPYPYSSNDSLTQYSTPALELYNYNVDSTKYIRGAIYNITQNSDGTIAFEYKSLRPTSAGISGVVATSEEDNKIYTISGVYLGTDFDSLPHGVYIVGKKKVVK